MRRAFPNDDLGGGAGMGGTDMGGTIDPFNAGDPASPQESTGISPDELAGFGGGAGFDGFDGYDGYDELAEEEAAHAALEAEEAARARETAARAQAQAAARAQAHRPDTHDWHNGAANDRHDWHPERMTREEARRIRGDKLHALYETNPELAQQIARERHAKLGKTVVVFTVVAIVCAVVIPLAAAIIDAIDDDRGSSVYESPREVTTEIDEEAGEERIESLMTQRLDSLGTDESFVQSVAEAFSSQCEYYLGYTADELGVDAQGFAQWAVSGRTYEISSSHCYPGYDGDGPSGTVYFDSTGYDAEGVCEDFLDEADDYIDDQKELAGLGRSESLELSEQHKSAIRAILAEEMAQAGRDDDGFTAVGFVYNGDDWAIDEDDFAYEMQYLFVRPAPNSYL